MSLSIGIVGLANVGKSTLFEALTKKQVNISNYPFCTIDPNVGLVELPDQRLDKLAEISRSAKKIPTVVEFVDIAGLVRNASKGEGLGNQFLANIREVDAILFVVRCFENAAITHVENSVNPERDIDIVNLELILKDLETLQKRIDKAKVDEKTGKKPARNATPHSVAGGVIVDELGILEKLKLSLEEGKMAFQSIKANNQSLFDVNSPTGLENLKMIKDLQLLTVKPGIFILNSDKTEISPELAKKIKDLDSEYIIANLRDEDDASKFTEEEKKEFGLTVSKLNEIIEKSYQVLGLMTFFTTGPDETRAWTIKRGTKAPQASGVIHTDFEKKFICLDVINWQQLLEINQNNPGEDPWSASARLGRLKTQGKEYLVQDGDVLEVKHAP